MTCVVTLIAAQGKSPLDDSLVDGVVDSCAALGGHHIRRRWLQAETACALDLDGLDPEQAEAAARSALPNLPVDVIARSSADGVKRLLLADMDSTIVTGETLDELAEQAGIKDRIAAITARAMNGEIGFEGALKERVALLRGLPRSALEETWKRVELSPGAMELVAGMKAAGARCVLISGGFRFFVERVAAICGFDAFVCNDFLWEGETLAGTVAAPIIGREAKLATLIAEASALRIPLDQTLAVGDGANDLDMLLAAGLGVAYHAKPAVNARARFRVEHADLRALLWAQGLEP